MSPKATSHDGRGGLSARLHPSAAHAFEYWTLKESYAKARGLGLELPPDGFSSSRDAAGVRGISFESFHDDPSRWWFRSWKMGESRQVALAVATTDGLEVARSCAGD